MRPLWLLACLPGACARPAAAPRTFPDAPTAWRELDDAHVARTPEKRATLLATHGLEDLVVRDTARALGLEASGPAEDVNAEDEVPCSTWYCPRNHRAPLPAEAVRRGTAIGEPPVLPLTVIERKKMGVTPGFIALDARGRKYNVKLDPPGHPRLVSGAEVVCARLLWAAGYHTAANFPLRFRRDQVTIDPGAGMSRRELDALLARGARDARGRRVGLAVAWLPGEALGGFDMMGRRRDDPNDRIPHERRRSLRATYVLFAWLNLHDADASNWLDTLVEEAGRRFVRHWFLDFGGGLGASNTMPKPAHLGAEGRYEVPRTLGSIASLGLRMRPWQRRREARDRMVAEHPALGWIPVEGWDPNEFRTNFPVPAQRRLTPADAYWGAKVVTSFSDAQIAAAVGAAGYPPESAAVLVEALRRRRDAVAKAWLVPTTALEEPRVTPRGETLCWTDLSLARGYARRVGYRVRVAGRPARWLPPAGQARSCVPLGASPRYRVVRVRAKVDGAWARPVEVHVGFSRRLGRVAVLGIDREGRAPARGDAGSSSAPLALLVRPLTAAARAVEGGHLVERTRRALTWDGGRATLRPSAHWESGFLPTAGARLRLRPLVDLRARTLGPAATTASIRLTPAAPVLLEHRFERREDALFAGIGAIGASRWTRYTATRGRSRLRLSRGIGPVAFGVGGGVDVAAYDPGDGLLDDPPIDEEYPLILVPRFQEGLHLARLLANVTLDTRTRRHGGGVLLDGEGGVATGFAGDPSSHATFAVAARGAIPLDDRSLILAVRAVAVEPLGHAEIPFEELVTPGGADGLRGSPRGRLRGATALVATLEYRWLVHPRLDAALFLDHGGAFGQGFGGIRSDRLRPSLGFGILAWDADDLEGGAQVAWSPDDGVHLLVRVVE